MAFDWLFICVALLIILFLLDNLFNVSAIPCNLLYLGGITSTTAVVMVHGCGESMEIEILSSKSQSRVPYQLDLKFTTDDSTWFGSYEFKDLLPSTKYSVFYGNDSLHFKTFPSFDSDESEQEVTFTFGSCSAITSYPWNSLSSAFDKIFQLNPNLAFFLGDNVYTDIHESLPWLRVPFDVAHKRILGQKSVQNVMRTIPTYSMFDDHEIENDLIGGLNHPLAKKGLEAYFTYWGQRNPTRPGKNYEDWYYSFEYGKLATFFVMEARLSHNPIDKTIFSFKQKKAIYDWLKESKLLNFTYMILASPLSWSKDGHGETFSKDRDEFFEKVKALNICNLLIISGDMHFGAAYEHPSSILEFSASPFQAFPFWPDKNNGENRIFIYGGTNFYFGKVSLSKQKGGYFHLYRWPMFNPQKEPALFEKFEFNSTRC